MSAGSSYERLPAPPLTRRVLRELDGRDWYRARAGRLPAAPSAAGTRPAAGQAVGAGTGRSMTSAAPAPFPFLVGCGRSGTTLLRAMFDSHPDVAVPDEVAFIIRYARPHYALRYGWPRRFDARRCADLIVADASFRRWALGDADVRRALADPLPPLVRRHDPAAVRGGRRRPGQDPLRRQDSDARAPPAPPGAAFPRGPLRPRGARRARRRPVVPRRGVGSDNDRGGGGQVAARRAHGPSCGPRLRPARYREIRYEELVADPDLVLRDLCGFLQITWDDAMLDHQRNAAAVIASTRFPDAHRRLMLPATSGLRDWRRDMAAERRRPFRGHRRPDAHGDGLRPIRAPRVAASAARRSPPGGGRRHGPVVDADRRWWPGAHPPGHRPTMTHPAPRRDRGARLRRRGRARRAGAARRVARLGSRRAARARSSRGSTADNPFGASPAWVARRRRASRRLPHVPALGVRADGDGRPRRAGRRHRDPPRPPGPRHLHAAHPGTRSTTLRADGVDVRLQHAQRPEPPRLPEDGMAGRRPAAGAAPGRRR